MPVAADDLIFTEYEADNLWPLPKERSEIYRRSLYLLDKRTVRLPMLANFDQPEAMSSCAVRPVSTHALQALSAVFGFVNRRAHTAQRSEECPRLNNVVALAELHVYNLKGEPLGR